MNNNLAWFQLITTITWFLAYGFGQEQNRWWQKIHVKRWQFQRPYIYGGAMQGTLPDGAHPWLHAKPVDAAIGRVPVPYCLGSCHGQRFWKEEKNINKTQLLSSFLMVDQRKKAIESQDLPGTLYSCPRRIPSDPNPYATSQVEKLSYILIY